MLDWPSGNEKVTVPKFVPLSSKWRVAVLLPPQAPVAVKVKGRATAAALVTSTP